MSFIPKTWVDDQIVYAEDMNRIEQGIANAVSVTPQTLTDEQKTQARANIAAAPDGYGLGGNGTEVSDWNNATENGFYRDAEGTEEKHSPFVGVWSCGYVTNWSSGSLIQVAFGFPNINGRYVKCEKNREYISTGWGEWEWVNPPMQLGVEYRTTERYLGKPVYVKLIDCGNMPDGTTKEVAHGITNLGFIVGAQAIASDSSTGFNGIAYLPVIYNGSLTDRWTNYLAGVDANNIRIFCGGGLAGCPVYVTFKYTKTTD